LKSGLEVTIEIIKIVVGTIRNHAYRFLFDFHSNCSCIFRRIDTIHERDGRTAAARWQAALGRRAAKTKTMGSD